VIGERGWFTLRTAALCPRPVDSMPFGFEFFDPILGFLRRGASFGSGFIFLTFPNQFVSPIQKREAKPKQQNDCRVDQRAWKKQK